MINFIRGQKNKLTDLTSSQLLQVSLAIVDQAKRTFDISCFGVDAQNKLSDDRYFIFYNQTSAPDGSLAIVNSLPNDLMTFQLDLARLPSSIRKLVFVASLDGAGDMSQIQQGYIRLLVQGEEIGKFSFTGKDFSNEKAIIVAEIYWKEIWRFAAVGQGFKGGLPQLLEYFGGQEVLPAQTNPVPIIMKSPPPPVAHKAPIANEVILKKGESTQITLKKGNAMSQIRVKLSWTAGVDLDCHVFYRSKAGQFGHVYFVNKGSLTSEPYILLDKDAGVGNVAGQNEENVVISRLDYIEYALIAVNIFRFFGFLSSGDNFAKYDGKVLIETDHGDKIEVPLTSEENGKWCVIAKIDNSDSPRVENINRVHANEPTLLDYLG